MNRLKDDIAVVTGIGPRIGRAIAVEYAREGADLVLISTDAAQLSSVAAAVEAEGRAVRTVEGDVSDWATWREAERAADELGGAGIVVNSAANSALQNIMDMEQEDWDKTLDVNLTALFRSVRTFAPGMLRRGRGVFVNISSVNAVFANPAMTDYASTKAGVNAFTRTVALELGRGGIRANAIAPGAVFTDEESAAMEAEEARSTRDGYLVGRWGRPEDIASAAVYLASDEASFVTGTVLTVDGGLSIQSPEATGRKSFRARWRDD